MIRPWYRLFLYVGTLPTDVVGWLTMLVVRALWGRDLGWVDGVLFVRLLKDSWFERTFYKQWAGTAIGHAVMISDRTGTETTIRHELVHVEQVEGAGLAGLFCALLVLYWSWWVALLLWALMPSVIYVASGCAAVLRGESWYRGNHLEEAARAVAGQAP